LAILIIAAGCTIGVGLAIAVWSISVPFGLGLGVGTAATGIGEGARRLLLGAGYVVERRAAGRAQEIEAQSRRMLAAGEVRRAIGRER